MNFVIAYVIFSLLLGIVAAAAALYDNADTMSAGAIGLASALLWPLALVLVAASSLLYVVFVLPAKLLLRFLEKAR